MTRSPQWSQVEALIDQQRHQAAFDLLATIRDAARTDPAREAEATEALVKQAQLRIALHGDETALRFIREEPWPTSLLYRTVLEVFLGHVTLAYLRKYSWEIR